MSKQELVRHGLLPVNLVNDLDMDSEPCEIPQRDEPDKYIYIFTDEEKMKYGPTQSGDECWVMMRNWYGDHLKVGKPFSNGCYFRRLK